MSSFTVTIEYDDAKIRVTGTATPFKAARTNCAYEDAEPAEGGLEEITEARLLDAKGEPVELPSFLQEELDERIIDKALCDQQVQDKLIEMEINKEDSE